MDCFYTPQGHVFCDSIEIVGTEFHHLTRVMRKIPGDTVMVTVGTGNMYETTILEITKNSAVCRIDNILEGYNELSREVSLIQGVLKNPSKMDWIVEKATEFGVSHIHPVATSRTVAKGGKVERWRNLSLAAMKQCMRSSQAEIHELQPLEKILAQLPVPFVVCHEAVGQERNLEMILQSLPDSIAVCIGPEGGFNGDEIQMMESAGGICVSLGSRRLRSETASIAALARISAYLETQ